MQFLNKTLKRYVPLLTPFLNLNFLSNFHSVLRLKNNLLAWTVMCLFLNNTIASAISDKISVISINKLVCTVTPGSISGDQNVCYDGDPTELTEVTPAGGCAGTITYQWQSSTINCVSGFTDIEFETNASFTPPGGALQTTYYRRKALCSDEVGCIAYSNCVTVTVVQAIASITQTDNSGNANDGIICKDGTAMLTALGGISYEWSPNIGTGAGPHAVSPMVTTSYTVTVTDADGCEDTDVETVIVIEVDASITETDNSGIDPDDGTICLGDEAELTGSGGISYQWAPYIGTGAGPHTVSPSSETIYSVTATDANGCTDQESFDLTVRPKPAGAITETDNSGNTNNDGEICAGDNATLKATPSSRVTYEWSTTETTATIIVSPPSTTTYTVTVTNNSGCFDIKSYTVTVHETPILTCPPDITVCKLISDYALAGGLPLGGVYSGPGIVTSPVFDATAAGLGVHIITYTFTDSEGCDFTSECNFSVTVVEDDGAPIANCITNQSRGTTSPFCYYVTVGPEFDLATNSDNCGVTTKSYTLSGATTGSGNNTLAGVVMNKGVTTVTWTVTDIAGRSASCSFTVTVTDDDKPTISCKPDQLRITNSGTCTYTTVGAEFNPESSADNCGITSLSYVLTGVTTGTGSNTLAGVVLKKGITTVQWKVTDDAGNTATCDLTVTVTGPDTDCDGIVNACDVCPGGDDTIDNNHDGLPDCKYIPSYDEIIEDWKCGFKKVYLCHIPPGNPGGAHTICINYHAVPAHMAQHGDYLGPCENANCDSELKGNNGGEYITGDEAKENNVHSFIESGELKLYPNPAQNILYVDLRFHTHSPVKIQMLNNMGQQLTSSNHIIQEHDETVIPLNIQMYPSGLYFINITVDGVKYQEKFAISK
jgi:hypothetical protein